MAATPSGDATEAPAGSAALAEVSNAPTASAWAEHLHLVLGVMHDDHSVRALRFERGAVAAGSLIDGVHAATPLASAGAPSCRRTVIIATATR